MSQSSCQVLSGKFCIDNSTAKLISLVVQICLAGLAIAWQIWLHYSLGSPRPVNELRTILTISASIQAQPESVFKILHTCIPGSLKLFQNFHGKTPPVLSKTVDLCLEMGSDFNFCYVRLPVEQNRENTYFINSSIHSLIHSFRTLDRFLFDYSSPGLNSTKLGHSTYLRTRWHSGYSC